jgi:RNA polymerase sigma-70 factor (ECF subfamily)
MDGDNIDAPTDEQLMLRLRDGDESGLAALMQRWEIPVKRFIFRLVGNSAEADDLAQEVFVRVFEKRQTYRPGARFSTWVFSIAANQAKNRLRWWKRHPVLSLDAWMESGGDIQAEGVPAGAIAMEQVARTEEVRRAVQLAMAGLPLDQRTAIALFEYEEKSVAEIAEILGCSAKAVENRLYRARQELRRVLAVVKAP